MADFHPFAKLLREGESDVAAWQEAISLCQREPGFMLNMAIAYYGLQIMSRDKAVATLCTVMIALAQQGSYYRGAAHQALNEVKKTPKEQWPAWAIPLNKHFYPEHKK